MRAVHGGPPAPAGGSRTRQPVPPANHWYICRQAASPEVAHEAERALLALGFDGESAREGERGVFVYAYLKTELTEP